MHTSPSYTTVDLRHHAVDIARRLSSWRHFLPAATELLTCENLSPIEIKRHSTKIVRLIELSHSTLTRSSLTSCSVAGSQTGLSPFKKTYFELLLMLHRIRHHINDTELQARIDRLLLPLPADHCSRPLRVTRHAPYHVPHAVRHRSPQSEEEDRKMMPPPSFLPNVEKRRHANNYSVRLVCDKFDNVPYCRSLRRSPRRSNDNSSETDSDDSDRDDERVIESEDEDEDEESPQVTYQQPRARLGILCTKRQPVRTGS
ncbi:hypothetical protein QCA50_008056 [Cerrena zonata]|uniref:Uncharacterized protein n=1 Tax=Cerrena zonata TaxID=2478898 RepID=A0AAW0GEJ3_9APHY